MSAKEIKIRLVEAHRSGDQAAMRELSQLKEKAKADQKKHCPRCGVRVFKVGSHCVACYNVQRYYANKLGCERPMAQ